LGEELYIIWLVRDIRGWVSSWLPVFDDYLKQTEYIYYSWGYDKKDFWTPYQNCNVRKHLMEQGFTQEDISNFQSWMSDMKTVPHKRLAAWWTVENALMKY
jgi:hypothetical protein